MDTCTRCHGSGWTVQNFSQYPCPRCGGSGEDDSDECADENLTDEAKGETA